MHTGPTPEGDDASRLAGEPTGSPGVAGEDGGAHRGLAIGHRFRDPDLLEQALRHRSWCAEQGGVSSNERLEFLGDAVLGLVIAELVYRSHPDLAEGAMAKARADVVNTRVLAGVADELGIGPELHLGHGEDLSGGRHKASILADAVEAVIGAVYLDGGLEAARALIVGVLGSRLDEAAAGPGGADHKSRLQELTVQQGSGVPRYDVRGFGPDHARRYQAAVYVADQRLGVGEGRSKKDAEQAAARAAFGTLRDERGGGGA
ncbi:MAG: ribonuclease III [Actinomycetota bacterium]|nr:ribonuclease III [Actinomycetota bacterium]